MGKTINKFIYSVKNQIAAFNLTDDFTVSDEFIYEQMLDVRAAVIDELNRNKKAIPDGYYQRICCLEIMCSNVSCETGVQYPEPEYYVDLPEIMSFENWSEIKYLGFPGFEQDKKFDRLNFDSWTSTDGREYTSTDPFFTVVDRTAYLKNLPTSGGKYLCLIALLSEPRSSCDWNDKSILPIPREKVHKMELITIKQILSTKNQEIPDVLNDALDAIQKVTQQQQAPQQ